MSSGVSIEPASPADLEAILRLAEAFYGEADYPFDGGRLREALRVFLTEPGHGFVWIVTEEAEAIGYVVLTLGYSLEYLGRDAFIDELYVQPEYRRRGVARRAYDVVESAARRFDVNALHLQVERDNEKALELYRKMGFVAHERVLMTKRLGVDENE